MKTLRDVVIFLVDDDKLFLKSLEYHLQHRLKYTIKIRSFPTGEECLNNLHQNPTIVVLDYLLNANYPDAMNGVQVLQKIKETNPEIEVIMLSGHEKVEVALETMKYGAYDYVLKNETVLLKIQSVIRNAIDSIAVKRQVKTYKLLMQIIGGIALVILLIVLVKRMFLH